MPETMIIPRIALDNSRFTLVVFLLLLLFGTGSFLTMPRSEDPPLQIPGASVIIIYPGGNPIDLEQLIASPLEEALNELDDIKRLTSTMRDGIVIFPPVCVSPITIISCLHKFTIGNRN